MFKNKKIFNVCLILGSSIIPMSILTSCSSVTTSVYFAELVISDNTSVLKDKSFNENSYNGWRNFMIANKVNPKTGDVTFVENFNNRSQVNNEAYEKESINMPKPDSTSKLLAQGRGLWRRPNKSKDLTYRQIFSGGANLIIAPGFNNQQAIETVAPQEKDKGFLFLDGVPTTQDNNGNWIKEYPNVASFLFRAEQSGFLAGVATGEFLNINKDIFAPGGNDSTLKVGGFVGLPFASTVDFLAGFQHGIIAYNKQVKKTNASLKSGEQPKKEIEWINSGNDIGNYATNSFSPGQGTQKSNELIKQGADVIIPIAGAQISDLISTINNQTNPRPVAVVGVDSVQENNSSIQKEFDKKIIASMNGKKLKDANGNELPKQNIIQFSAEKKVDKATTKVLAAIFNQKNPNNSSETDGSIVKGFGYLNTGSLGNETTGVSEAGLPYVLKAFPNWEKIDNSKKTGKLDAAKVYENNVFIKLESDGVLYKDISKFDNNIDENIVKSSVFSNNRLVDPISNNEYSPAPKKLYQTGGSLNGAFWGWEKGTIMKETNREFTFKKYE